MDRELGVRVAVALAPPPPPGGGGGAASDALGVAHRLLAAICLSVACICLSQSVCLQTVQPGNHGVRVCRGATLL
jgi:hypothetical protein